jgi:hypothetical protein
MAPWQWRVFFGLAANATATFRLPATVDFACASLPADAVLVLVRVSLLHRASHARTVLGWTHSLNTVSRPSAPHVCVVGSAALPFAPLMPLDCAAACTLNINA